MAEEPKFKKPKMEDEEDENTESKSKFYAFFILFAAYFYLISIFFLSIC